MAKGQSLLLLPSGNSGSRAPVLPHSPGRRLCYPNTFPRADFVVDGRHCRGVGTRVKMTGKSLCWVWCCGPLIPGTGEAKAALV